MASISLRRYICNVIQKKCRLVFFIVGFIFIMKFLLEYENIKFDIEEGRLERSGGQIGSRTATPSGGKHVQTCAEKQNFVFIKCMKTAGTTMLGLLRRFGHRRKLTFVLPVKRKLYINWPFPLTRRDYRPSRRGYNILIDHAVFAEKQMAAIMPNNTIYLTSIRHPLEQLKSTFNYFKVHATAGIPENAENPVAVFFSDPERYERAYKAADQNKRYCMPDGFSLTKNIMSTCLGMPLGFPAGSNDISSNEIAVQNYINYLDNKFSLVIIVEHFYESIVLLKRIMCWNFSDLVFFKMNVIPYNYKHTEMPQYVIERHHQWSSVDYKLYGHFNASLWQRINQQGPGFHDEVAAFKTAQDQVSQYCFALLSLRDRDSVPVYLNETRVTPSAWSDSFSVTPEDCDMLTNPYGFLQKLQQESDTKDQDLLRQQNSIGDPRRLKGMC